MAYEIKYVEIRLEPEYFYRENNYPTATLYIKVKTVDNEYHITEIISESDFESRLDFILDKALESLKRYIKVKREEESKLS